MTSPEDMTEDDANVWRHRALVLLGIPENGGTKFYTSLDDMHWLELQVFGDDYARYSAAMSEDKIRPLSADAWTRFFWFIKTVLKPKWDRRQEDSTHGLMTAADLQQAAQQHLDDMRALFRAHMADTGDTFAVCQLVGIEQTLNELNARINGIQDEDMKSAQHE